MRFAVEYTAPSSSSGIDARSAKCAFGTTITCPGLLSHQRGETNAVVRSSRQTTSVRRLCSVSSPARN